MCRVCVRVLIGVSVLKKMFLKLLICRPELFFAISRFQFEAPEFDSGDDRVETVLRFARPKSVPQ